MIAHAHLVEMGLWQRLPWIIDNLTKDNIRQVAIYGNGSHTKLLHSIWQKLNGPDIALIIVSENPSTAVIEGLPVMSIAEVKQEDIKAIVLSSHRYEIAMSNLCEQYLPLTPVFFVHNKCEVNTHLISQNIIRHFLSDETFYIVDGGAINMLGHDTGEFWPAIPPKHMQVYAFEPDAKECDAIERTAQATGHSIKAFPYGLWNEVTEKVLYLTQNRTGSSFFKPNLERLSRYYYCHAPFAQQMSIRDEFRLKVTSLDTLWKEGSIEQLDFIKLNIEGAEKKAIEGGQQALAQALGIQLEMGFNEKVKGGPLFADVDPLLRDMGFELFDILSLNRYSHIDSNVDCGTIPGLLNSHCGNARHLTQQIFEGHFIYFRNTHDWNSLEERFGGDIFTKLFKLACLQEMYGHLDAAFATLRLIAAHIPDPDSQTKLSESILHMEQQCYRQGLHERSQHAHSPA